MPLVLSTNPAFLIWYIPFPCLWGDYFIPSLSWPQKLLLIRSLSWWEISQPEENFHKHLHLSPQSILIYPRIQCRHWTIRISIGHKPSLLAWILLSSVVSPTQATKVELDGHVPSHTFYLPSHCSQWGSGTEEELLSELINEESRASVMLDLSG